MKRTLKYSSIVLLSLGLTLTSCQDFVDGLDVNPNAPAIADAQNMLQGVQLADALIHGGEAARISAMWTSQFTGSNQQYASINQYEVTAANFDNTWSTIYVDVATQCRIGAARALEERNSALSGIFLVVEAHALGTAASLFGDIPFQQVGDRINFPNPAYDSQRQVYDDLQAQLDEAIVRLDAGGGSSRDLFYTGNTAAWKEAARTLKARYYLHTKQYNLAQQAALQGISTSANDMLMPHKESDGAENFYFQFNAERLSYLTAFDSYAARILDPARRTTVVGTRNNTKTDESERFAFYFGPSITRFPGSGTPRPPIDPDKYQLKINSGFAEPGEDFPLITYSETQLILAETYARAGDLTNALVALNSHRVFLATKFPGGRYEAYVSSDIPGGGTQSNLLREILTERYVSFIGQVEPFNDLRRTNNLIGLPNKRQVAGQPTPPYPERFLYSQAEINTNTSLAQPIPDLYAKTPVNQ